MNSSPSSRTETKPEHSGEDSALEDSVAGMVHGHGAGALRPTRWLRNLPEFLIGGVILTAGSALLWLAPSAQPETVDERAPPSLAPHRQASIGKQVPSPAPERTVGETARAAPEVPWVDELPAAVAACSKITAYSREWSIPRQARAAKRGHDMLLLGDLNEAREAFCEATQHDSPSELSLSGLVRTQLLLGDPKSALKSAKRLVARAPNSPEAHNLTGDVLLRLGRTEEAQRAFTRGAGGERLSDWLRARIRKTSLVEAREAIAAAAYPRAERMLRRALAFDPRDVDTLATLVLVLRKSKKTETAIHWLDYAETIDPAHPRLRRERAKLDARQPRREVEAEVATPARPKRATAR